MFFFFLFSVDAFPNAISLKSFDATKGIKERSTIVDVLDKNSLSSRMGVFLVALKHLFDEKAGMKGLIDVNDACSKLHKFDNLIIPVYCLFVMIFFFLLTYQLFYRLR